MNAKAKFSFVSLQDLVDRLEPGNPFTPQRCRDIRSAVNCLAKALGRTAESIPASPVQLRSALGAEPPASSGISSKRWKNMRADILALIKQHSLQQHASPRIVGEWASLKARLPSKHLKNTLSGFMTYCSLQNIAPDQVNDAVLSAYHQHLVDETLRKKPNQIHRGTCKTWNEAASLVPGWPQQMISLPDYRERQFALDWEVMPELLQREVDDYLRWLEGKFFERDSPTRFCKRTTTELVRRQLQAAISAATPEQNPAHCPHSLAELVSKERLFTLAQFYRARTHEQPSQYLHDLIGVLVRLGKYWLDLDAKELEVIKQFRRRMGKQSSGLTDKNRRTITELQDPLLRRKLMGLPDLLEKQALKLKDRRRQAVHRQLAVAIDLLIHAPMRSGNLVTLRIDQHLFGLNTPGEMQIELGRDEVKNDQPLMYPLSGKTAERLRRYLKEEQPILGGPSCQWLFPGEDPVYPKQQKTLCQQLQKFTLKHLGIKISPHQFRHLAADLILTANPGAYPLVQRLLGHRSMKTTANFYSGAEMKAAVSAYDKILHSEASWS